MSDDTQNKASLLTFPCEFPIKVIGKADLDFQGAVLGIVRKHVPALGEAAVDTHYSKEGHYVSLTVMVTATSQEQLDAIYVDLTADNRVMMVL